MGHICSVGYHGERISGLPLALSHEGEPRPDMPHPFHPDIQKAKRTTVRDCTSKTPANDVAFRQPARPARCKLVIQLK
ncbi:hypothetical protein [Microbacterium gorillae]|uniref:hypothetical protein n=1 Tax=Microbacterium gorillae TaxID=1231063 RepID=UPI003D98481D